MPFPSPRMPSNGSWALPLAFQAVSQPQARQTPILPQEWHTRAFYYPFTNPSQPEQNPRPIFQDRPKRSRPKRWDWLKTLPS